MSSGPFRGVIAPASLKRVETSPFEDPQNPFPGRYRPGLIEAALGAEGKRGEEGALSGALSPRPH